jgi:excisionase family DNA binding protein
MSHKLLRIPLVAELLQISETSIRRLIRQGRIPSIRVGRQIRVDEAVLEQWLRAGGSQSSTRTSQINCKHVQAGNSKRTTGQAC